MAVKDYNNNVFINCPFDDEFDDIFYAVVFCIFDSGFIARCAKEDEDGSDIRISKIYSIIRQCRYGIHDISRTELCKTTKLPRFNMPYELGLFIGAKQYGDKDQKKKKCLITDNDPNRYNIFISDIRGQDIRSHKDSADESIRVVSNWLRSASRRKSVSGGKAIIKRYKSFQKDLPSLCKVDDLEVDELNFNDYCQYVSAWLEVQRISVKAVTS